MCKGGPQTVPSTTLAGTILCTRCTQPRSPNPTAWSIYHTPTSLKPRAKANPDLAANKKANYAAISHGVLALARSACDHLIHTDDHLCRLCGRNQRLTLDSE